jgi:hypothetical protein
MALSRKTTWTGQVGNPTLVAQYYDHVVVFYIHDPTDPAVKLQLDSNNTEFWELLNVDPYPPALQTPFVVSHSFQNVWDRKTLFLHASFVTSTTAGYLGRGGEFYPKPSKMYRTAGPDFYIETSLDGYHPLPMPYENWILELTCILDADDYQSP